MVLYIPGRAGWQSLHWDLQVSLTLCLRRWLLKRPKPHPPTNAPRDISAPPSTTAVGEPPPSQGYSEPFPQRLCVGEIQPFPGFEEMGGTLVTDVTGLVGAWEMIDHFCMYHVSWRNIARGSVIEWMMNVLIHGSKNTSASCQSLKMHGFFDEVVRPIGSDMTRSDASNQAPQTVPAWFSRPLAKRWWSTATLIFSCHVPTCQHENTLSSNVFQTSCRNTVIIAPMMLSIQNPHCYLAFNLPIALIVAVRGLTQHKTLGMVAAQWLQSHMELSRIIQMCKWHRIF